MSNLVRPSGAITRRGEHRCGFQDLIWRTAEGERIRIGDMDSKHMFNAMKMCFNHLAGMWGGQPVWFTKRYADYDMMALSAPERLAKYVVAFTTIIDDRGDLPEQYQLPYAEIKKQIVSRSQALAESAEVA